MAGVGCGLTGVLVGVLGTWFAAVGDGVYVNVAVLAGGGVLVNVAVGGTLVGGTPVGNGV